MAKPIIDISVLGDKQLERDLARFVPSAQKGILRKVLRASGKRQKARLVANLSGGVVKPESGRWLRATIAEPVRAIQRTRLRIGVAFSMPTRQQLGIDPKDKSFYPAAIEYGYTKKNGDRVAAKRPIRRAVDDHAKEETAILARELGQGIERAAAKHFRRSRVR